MPPTIAHCLANYTCPFCHAALGRFHAYHLHLPGMPLSQLADHAPAHLGCIEAKLEEAPLPVSESPNLPATAITCIVIVKATPNSPSGRLLTLPHPTSGEPTHHIHLFTPETFRFLHLSAHPAPGAGVNTITRPASPQEIMAWMQPALTDALSKATTPDERRAIFHQLGLISKKLPERERAEFKATVKALTDPSQSSQ